MDFLALLQNDCYEGGKLAASVKDSKDFEDFKARNPRLFEFYAEQERQIENCYNTIKAFPNKLHMKILALPDNTLRLGDIFEIMPRLDEFMFIEQKTLKPNIRARIQETMVNHDWYIKIIDRQDDLLICAEYHYILGTRHIALINK